jgi:hypothetical protein
VIKSNKPPLVIALLCALLAFAGCSKTETTATNNSNAVVVNTNKTVTTTTETAKETAPAGDKIGVAECDEYVQKFEACLTKIAANAPQAQGPMKTAFEAQRKAFKDSAATPGGKANLATTCKQASDTAKQSTAAYKCDW